MKDLRIARKSAGHTQEELEELTGIDQSVLSKMERGEKMMSDSIAERLARHLPGTSASELLVSNKALAFRKAQERGDRVGVLQAAKSIVAYCESLPTDPQLDDMLDALVAKAVGFAESPGSVVDPEEYGQEKGRNILGVRKSRFLPDEEEHTYPTARVDESFYPAVPGSQDTVLPVEEGTTDDHFGGDVDEEEYGDVDDGRDLYGIRIRPLEETD